jgi:penicillin-binding protein 1A
VSDFFKLFLKIFGICAALGILVVSILFYHYSKDLPDFSKLSHYHPPAVTRIYSSDGALLEEYAKEYRVFVPISTIPRSVIDAFIAAEDRNYYDHPGIDVFSIIRAAFDNIGNLLNRRRFQGGSTITQQVVKNFLLTSERSIPRKIKEAILSYRISKSMTKDQVLELYLNQMYLGKGAYGVAAAASVYFDKSIDELNVAESAFIAALPKAPSSINPDKNYERSVARRNYVINRMAEDGYITEEIAELARNEPIKLIKRSKEETVTAGYYAETVREQIVKLLGADMFYTGGLTVITSMDAAYQKQAEASLRKGIREYDLKRGYKGPITKISLDDWKTSIKEIDPPLGLLEYELAVILNVEDASVTIGLRDGKKSTIALKEMLWAATNLKSAKRILNPGDVVVVEPVQSAYGLRQIPKVNGAFMVMRPGTGQVLALVGGYDFATNKFNRATQAIRQPGSSIKPFVYLAALENGIQPNTLFDDAPVALSQGAGMPMWKPKNYKSDFLGTITMRKALEKSRNLVTVRVMQRTGIDKVAEMVSRFGISENPQHYFSMGLGAIETTVEKMISAYSTVINSGHKVTPQYIETIQDSTGKVIYKRPSSAICSGCNNKVALPQLTLFEGPKLIDEVRDYQFISMLEGVVQRGTAARAAKLGKAIAGKTGTTNDSFDTWFIGCTPLIATATYIGFDTPKTLGKSATGSSVALPIFIDFMEKAYKDVPSLPFKVPESIKQVKVDEDSGKPYDGPGAILEAFPKDDESLSSHGNSLEGESRIPESLHKDITKQSINSGIY